MQSSRIFPTLRNTASGDSDKYFRANRALIKGFRGFHGLEDLRAF